MGQCRVLLLGEIHDSPQAAWRKRLEVFDEQQQSYTSRSLFPEDRPVPTKAVDSLQGRFSERKWQRARPYGGWGWEASGGGISAGDPLTMTTTLSFTSRPARSS